MTSKLLVGLKFPKLSLSSLVITKKNPQVSLVTDPTGLKTKGSEALDSPKLLRIFSDVNSFKFNGLLPAGLDPEYKSSSKVGVYTRATDSLE